MKVHQYCILMLKFIIMSAVAHSQCAKFEPEDGKALLILGQDLGAVGGFAAPNNNGYIENVGGPVPFGITSYLSIPSLAGMTSITNYGSGDVCNQCVAHRMSFTDNISFPAPGQFNKGVTNYFAHLIFEDRNETFKVMKK